MCFIILTYLVPVLFTFYIQGVLKLKKIITAPKVYAVGTSVFVDRCVQRFTPHCLIKNVLTSRRNLPPGRSRPSGFSRNVRWISPSVPVKCECDPGCTYVGIETAKMWVTLWMGCFTDHPRQVIDFMKQSFRSWWSLSYSRSPSVRYPEYLIACSKEPESGTYRQKNESHPLWFCFVIIHFNIILLCTLEVSNRLWGTFSSLFLFVHWILRWHCGRKGSWGCLRTWCWGEYLDLGGTK